MNSHIWKVTRIGNFIRKNQIFRIPNNITWRFDFPWDLLVKPVPQSDDLRAIWNTSRRTIKGVVLPFNLGRDEAYLNIFENLTTHKMSLVIILPDWRHSKSLLRNTKTRLELKLDGKVGIPSQREYLPRTRHFCITIMNGIWL